MKKFVVSSSILIIILLMSITFAGDRVSLGYIYNSSKSHTEIVNDTRGNINVVSPTCFDLTSNGHLYINNIFNQEFVNEMHEQGILITPFLSNHWGRKKAEAALNHPEILANEVVEAINKYNLDGVNVDLENLLVSYKDKLTNFVKILREKMPEGKVLSIAVAANPNKLTSTWLAAYDYAGLAGYVDYMVLMAYDEHSAGGSDGPVASIGYVEQSIKVILESVSRDKVILGMPLYGRYWQEGAESGGEAVVISQVERIAKRYKRVPIYNSVTGTATVKINVKSGDKKAYINGRYLDEGIYTIWYENEDSITRKMNLMNDYGLKGAALWALGNESDEFWNYYSKGFENENYESEQEINERAYYEYVERLIEQVEPLKLEGNIKIDKKLIQKFNYNADVPGTDFEDDQYAVPVEVPKPQEAFEKVVDRENNFKKIEKHPTVRTIKRYNFEKNGK